MGKAIKCVNGKYHDVGEIGKCSFCIQAESYEAKIKEFVDDLAEILNNLNDDLEQLPTDTSKVIAIKKYTLKVVKEKYKKYGGK